MITLPMLRNAHQSPENVAYGCRTALVECFLLLMNASSMCILVTIANYLYATIGQLSDVPTCMQSLSQTPRVLVILFRMHGSFQLSS